MAGYEGTPRPHRDPTGVAEQRAVEGCGPPGDHDQLQPIRLQHARSSLAAAVAEGRVAQADVDTVLERLARGEVPTRYDAELRRAGVLPGRAQRAGR